MEINHTPSFNALDTAETKCCPRFSPRDWDEQQIVFDNKLFIKVKTINFLHIPLNINSVFTKTFAKLFAEKAIDKNEFVALSYDPNKWRSEHYFSVTKEIHGMENVRLSGTFITKVFEGSFKNAGAWMKESVSYAKSTGNEIQQLYFFYTTCPKCAKYYGKNYVVAFIQIK